MGGAYGRAAATQLLRERIARCHGRRFARPVWRVLRHYRRAGGRIGGWGRYREPDCPRSSSGSVRRSTNPAMIRVELPYQLRTLAQVDGEVKLDIKCAATPTLGGVCLSLGYFFLFFA